MDFLMNHTKPKLRNKSSYWSYGKAEKNGDEISKFSFSLAVLIVLLHKYSSFLQDKVLLRINFNQPEAVPLLEKEYAVSVEQTFQSLFRKVEKEIRSVLGSDDLHPVIDADVEWVISNEENSFYYCSITPTRNGPLSVRFSCSFSSFFTQVFKKAKHHYTTLAKNALHNPLSTINDIHYVTGSEFKEISAVAYGEINEEISHTEFLHRLLEQTARNHPEAIAILHDGNSITYRALNNKATRLAKHLLHCGVKPGEFVGILLHRTPEVYIAMLGILKCGAAYVPLDADFPEDRIRFILEDAGVKLLISNTAFNDRYSHFSGTVLNTNLELTPVLTTEHHESNLDIDIHAQSPAYSIYTSGTTGRPKGVVVSHGAISNLVKAERSIFKVSSTDRVLQGFSVAFDASLEEIWLAFLSGAALCPAGKELMCSGEALGKFINEKKISVLSTVPTMLSMMQPPLPSLKLLILGGEPCSHELLARWHRTDLRIVNTYGPTEATVIATYAEFVPDKKITIGRPVANYAVFVTDQNVNPVPLGVPGELCIAGKGLALGYLNRRELTEEKFCKPSFDLHPSLGKRIYRTGDLARFNGDGQLEFLGRTDSQVKLRGYRIELSEIESQLIQFHNVKNAAVTVQDDEENGQRLVAYILLKDSAENFDEARCKIFLKARLSAYMVPSLFVVMQEFPTLASGKVDKKKLPIPAADLDTKTNSRAIVSPHNAVEEQIHAVWTKFFAPLEVSVTDDFFLDLGGHSLLAAKTVSELRKQKDFHDLSVIDIYKNPTIEKLAHARLQASVKSDGNGNGTSESGTARASEKKTEQTSRVRHFVAGVTQFFSLYALFGFHLLMGTVMYLTFFYFYQQQYPWLQALGWALMVSILAYPALILVAIAAKWILLGRIKPGRHKLWGWFYLRWWFVHKLLHGLDFYHFSGTPLLPYIYRLLGMRIGKDVHLETDHFSAFDIITIGDGTSIDENASLPGYSVNDGYLIIGSITVGKNCFIGTRSVLAENTVMEDEARLDDLSFLPAGERVPAGETWEGSPARKTMALNPVKLLVPPAYGKLHRAALLALYVVLVFTVPIVSFIAFVPGIAFLIQLDPLGQPLVYLSWLPVVGASFVLLLTLEVVILKWLLVGRVRSGVYPVHGGFYIRNWIVDQLLRISLAHVGQLHATLHVIPWYKALGMKIGKMVELSTAASTTPDLINLNDGSTIADEASLGSPHIERGWMTIAPVRLGRRSFIGNSAVVPAGSTLGDGSLVGVLSITPKPGISERTHATWFGSPAILFPKREASAHFSEERTYNPPKKLRFARAAFELLRVTLPPAGFIVVAASVIVTALALWSRYGLFTTMLILPVVLGIACTVILLAVVVVKWIVVGRYKPFVKPLWSNFVWRLELVNALYEFLAAPIMLEALQGTPFLPMYLRLLGAKIGKACYLDTTGFLEWDLVEIGDRTSVGEAAIMQTHLFEDRILKASHLQIGCDCSIGVASVVLYDSKMEDGSSLDSLTLLMKGEILPAGTAWEGIPASPKAKRKVKTLQESNGNGNGHGYDHGNGVNRQQQKSIQAA
jgi:non-ribosomal peptide synthetase-like protein